jgi:MoxR-like ATPase
MIEKDIRRLTEQVATQRGFVTSVLGEVHKVIVGQQALVERLLVGLLTRGHLLIEGVPGLAKTLSVRTLAAAVEARFQRIQFTPDLLPADIVGTMVYDPGGGGFTPRKGPIFANIVLADEVNRAPAKVQSALLEAMEERQVTIGDTSWPLPEPFLVLATQNPIEQEGTYVLPEAQVDRFMLKLKVDYPSLQEERAILDRMTLPELPRVAASVAPEQLLRASELVQRIYVDERVRDYIVRLVHATRSPEDYGAPIAHLIRYGGSPRATIYLNQAARAHAFLRGRGYVTPEDVKAVGMDVLRHRIILSYEAEAEDVSSEDIVRQIFDTVEVP